jgi:hypothetical protein
LILAIGRAVSLCAHLRNLWMIPAVDAGYNVLMAEDEDKPNAKLRWWQWIRLASMAAAIAMASPFLFAGLLTLFVGGFVIRWLWALRA